MRARLKITAMALATLFALSAVGTSAAQAASSLDVGAVPAWITADQIVGKPMKLSLRKEPAGATLSTVRCNVGHLEVTTISSNLTEATLTPSYKECELGGLFAEVKVNFCRYTLTNTSTALTALADVVSCNPALEIVQGSCVIKIGNQNLLSHIVFANVAGTNPTHVTANVTVMWIEWSGGANCPANLKNVFGTGAELSGSTTFKAFEIVGSSEGAQVKLEAT